ncbi:hypothetical protein HDE_03960 [Halotydeus destructor]|nr:hypothetical protein HDE_03960 [Halotydeus destructor]
MVARLFVLAMVMTCVTALNLNCHMDRDRVGFIFEQKFSWVYKRCDRLILNIGSLDKDGRLQVPAKSPMAEFQSSRKYNSDLKLFLRVEILPEQYSELGKTEFRDNMVQTVAGLLRDKQLDGAVFDVDPQSKGTKPDAGFTKAHIQHLLRDLKQLVGSEGKTIGLVTPVGGPLQVESPADCDSLDQIVDFIELATHQLLANIAENRFAHRSAMGPYVDDASQLNRETNIEHAVKTWLGKCELMKPKLYLTVSPQGWGQVITTDSKHGPLLAAGKGSHSFRFQQLCNAHTIHYVGWEAPVAILDHDISPGALKMWVSFDDQISLDKKVVFARAQKVAGISFNTVTDDDIYGDCDDGSLPLFSSVSEILKPNIVKSTAKSLVSDISPASDKLDRMCQAAAKVCKV